jgi:competence protein ComEC
MPSYTLTWIRSLVPYLKDIWYYAAQLRTTIIQNLEKNNFHKRVKCSRSFNFGKKQDLSPDILQDYQYAGHILSVSGLHVGFLLLFLTFILKPIPNTQKALPKLILILLSLASFALIAGLTLSCTFSNHVFVCSNRISIA